MRKSSVLFLSLTTKILLSCSLLFHAYLSESTQQTVLAQKAELVKTLRLTDLSLFTEARYTRHLSQADLATAFQDHPLSLEHFPSGSFTQPLVKIEQP
jgi:hypothetical protein